MSNLKISGEIHKIYDRETVSEKFTKREFVVKIKDGNYEQFAKFQLTQDRCEVLDAWNEGQDVTVHFNLRGREWQEKYFTNLEAWKIEGNVTASKPASANQEPVPAGGEPTPPDGDLPF